MADAWIFAKVRKGDRFDFFGQVLEVLKVHRDGSFNVGRRVTDDFGKESIIDVKNYHLADLRSMGLRKLPSAKPAPRRRGHSAPRLLRDMEVPMVLGHELDRKTLTPVREYLDLKTPGDYGADPIGDGTFRMVPSGDIVDFEERTRRLARFRTIRRED